MYAVFSTKAPCDMMPGPEIDCGTSMPTLEPKSLIYRQNSSKKSCLDKLFPAFVEPHAYDVLAEETRTCTAAILV